MIDFSHVFRFPFDFAEVTSEFSASGTQNLFRITSKIQSFELDNLRLVRIDIPLSLRIAIPFTESTRPDLVSGWYRFSFFAKLDPTAETTDQSTLNRFHSSTVVAAINNDENVLRSGDEQGSEIIDYTEWQEIVVRSFLQITEPDDPTDTMIELVISVADTATSSLLDSGSLLLSAPSLTFSESQ